MIQFKEDVEYNYDYYRKCLRRLLKKHIKYISLIILTIHTHTPIKTQYRKGKIIYKISFGIHIYSVSFYVNFICVFVLYTPMVLQCTHTICIFPEKMNELDAASVADDPTLTYRS